MFHLMTLPNYLTLFRIFLIPVFVVAYYLPFERHFLVSAIIFAIAGFSDFFDGYLARKTGQTSALGAFLDPVADKLMVVVALVLLVWSHHSHWMTIPAFLIIGREITISALREWMAEMKQSTEVSVSWIGKIKTVAQMVAITGLIANQPSAFNLTHRPDFSIGTVWWSYFFFYLSVLLTFWSLVLYLRSAWPHFVQAKEIK